VQGVGTGVVFEGIQKCFCMGIQRFERDSTKVGTTHNWVGHYYTIGPLNQVQIKSKLCYNSQTRFKQVINNWIYSICRRCYLVVTRSNSTQEKWQIDNLYRFLKIQCNHKEGSIPITFHIWNVEHSSRVWGIYFFIWVFMISSNLYSSNWQIQNYICYRLGGFYMEGDVIWNEKWTSNIQDNYYQNIQRIFGQFYEDIYGWFYGV